jgi:hypothetical protein
MESAGSASGMRQIIVEVATEAAKKQMSRLPELRSIYLGSG